MQIPLTQFAAGALVEDEVRFEAVNRQPIPCCRLRRGHFIRPDGILLILESPHKDEYIRQSFTPVGPLQKDDKFKRHLRSVLDAVRTSMGIAVPNGDIVFCNPVQYQASLAQLFPSRASIKKMPRDSMWNALYARGSIQNDFIRRVAQYRPRLVIEACSGKDEQGTIPGSPKEAVQGTLLDLRRFGILTCPIIAVGHPAWWNGRTFNHIYRI